MATERSATGCCWRRFDGPVWRLRIGREVAGYVMGRPDQRDHAGGATGFWLAIHRRKTDAGIAWACLGEFDSLACAQAAVENGYFDRIAA